ncbi:MAG: DNA helicase PcrA [Clostridiales bacterium]|nr:DNA helicase PcrA [Clostridiales bacterium]
MGLARQLNPRQREAVFHTEGPILVLAGAGSGKTRVLTYRVAHLIGEIGVRAENILAITFTNKASKEMKERIDILAGDSANGAWVGTFHSICVRILRREIDKLGFTRNFVIYDADDQLTLIKECIRELNLSDKYYNARDMRSRISGLKDQIKGPEDFRKEVQGQFREEKIAELYKMYQDRLTKNNALDFDDLINKTLELFYLRPEVLDYYGSRFQYILVDEYQDTNYAQYMLVKLLSMKHQNLCVVGDDDQSIYGWRGADIRNILEFEKDFPKARIVKLEENYRSFQTILEAANGVIKNNNGRKEKRLWTKKGQGERISLYKTDDEKHEADIVCRNIMSLINKEKHAASDFAVLYRTNAQSRALEDAFMKYGIPYRMYGGLRFYDRREIKDIIAYLRVVSNPADDVSLKRIINVPKRGIGSVTVARLEEEASKAEESIFGMILERDEWSGITPRARKKIAEFKEIVSNLVAMKEIMPLTEFIQTLIELTGYEKELEAEKTTEAETRLENIREFVTAAEDFERNNPGSDLTGFLENVALITDLDTLGEGQSAVNMMTMHSAKGLEFPIVFITGMEENLFPHVRSMDSDHDMEEERRLCYVGITRAKQRLYLTYSAQRNIFGSSTHNMPSRFLKEIPDTLMDFSDLSTVSTWNGAGYGTVETQYNRHRSINPANTSKSGAFLGVGKLNGVYKENIDHRDKTVRKFSLGQKVVHKKFGKGTVIAINGAGEDKELKIAFEQGGIRSFMAIYAPIKEV